MATKPRAHPKAHRAHRMTDQVSASATPAYLHDGEYRSPGALVVHREQGADLTLALYSDRTYTFGRAEECTVVFPASDISRLHGQLSFSDQGQWVYRDLNSANGSRRLLANGEAQPLTGRAGCPMSAGDTIALGRGSSRISFLFEPPGDAVSAAPAFRSAASLELERRVLICARHNLPVFVLGPTGAGKTHAARRIHTLSRAPGSFVAINCGRLPRDPTHLHSELLGHVAGAFTGAVGPRLGKLAAADGGTLFLDEVESLPEVAQDFLLDVLEGGGSFAPLGQDPTEPTRPPRFRLISASKAELRKSALRPDLAQRLAAGDLLVIPTLEERREDVPMLIASFLAELDARQQMRAELDRGAVALLTEASWPGQIRELEATVISVVTRAWVERTIVDGASGPVVVTAPQVMAYLADRKRAFGDEPPVARPTADASPRKRPAELRRDDVAAALAAAGGNKAHAARALGIALNTLKAKLRAFGLDG